MFLDLIIKYRAPLNMKAYLYTLELSSFKPYKLVLQLLTITTTILWYKLDLSVPIFTHSLSFINNFVHDRYGVYLAAT